MMTRFYERRDKDITEMTIDVNESSVTIYRMFGGEGWTSSLFECADQLMRHHRCEYLGYKRNTKGKVDAANGYIKMRTIVAKELGVPEWSVQPQLAWIPGEFGYAVMYPERLTR
jgi:hypothetical protein